jgi:hypothetical protein
LAGIESFGLFWSWRIRRGKLGRPAVPKEVRELIRMLSRENPLWGAPHIRGELLKLGIHVGETSVSKYMVRRRKPPSQTWRTFLDNHLKTMVSVDFLHRTNDPVPDHIRVLGAGTSNCVKRFPGIPRHAICCGIAIESSARTSWSR